MHGFGSDAKIDPKCMFLVLLCNTDLPTYAIFKSHFHSHLSVDVLTEVKQIYAQCGSFPAASPFWSLSLGGEGHRDKQRLDSVFLKQNNQLNEDRDANRPGLHVAKGSHAINTVQEIIKHWTQTKLLPIWFLHCGFVEETLHQVKNADEWWIKIRANLIKWSSRDFCLSSQLVLATGFV